MTKYELVKQKRDAALRATSPGKETRTYLPDIWRSCCSIMRFPIIPEKKYMSARNNRWQSDTTHSVSMIVRVYA